MNSEPGSTAISRRNLLSKPCGASKELVSSLLLKKHRTRRQCARLAPHLLRAIGDLKSSGFPQLTTLGETLDNWAAEVATMWRFTRSNGITEGFHTKIEVLQRQAYGFRNFSKLQAQGQSDEFAPLSPPTAPSHHSLS